MRNLILSVLCVLLGSPAAFAQVTTAFTYQGELAEGGQPSSGVYDMRFRLFNTFTSGTQAGPTLCTENVQVVNGRFTLELDFGQVFTGSSRFVEIEIRPDVGTLCSSAGGYVVLTPRQKLTATPHAAYSLTANAANSASLLNNQPPSFYQNAANLTSGTLPDARLSTNVSTLTGVQTFSDTKTFSAAPAFSAAGAPFSVSSTALVTNLNADLLDGLNSTAFALASHTHDASAIVSGTLADARLALNIPRLAQANTFTAPQVISAASQAPLALVGSNTGGTWLNLQNTGGGRTWNLIATGTTNGEGPGNLMIRDQTAGFVRMSVDPTGRVGIGTTSPGARLEVSAADAAMRVRNTNDPGGGFVQNTFSTLQLGLYNPTASTWGVIPAGGQRSMLGMQNTGRVGTLTNNSGSPTWRNTIDDGSGNASFQGNIAANNLPGIKHASRNTGTSILSNNSETLIEDITVNVPASGFLHITCTSVLYAYTTNPTDCQVFLELKETTGTEVLLKESPLQVSPPLSGPDVAIESSQVIHHVIPVSAGVRRFKVRIRHNGGGGGGTLRGGDITVMYFPSGL